MIDKLKQWLDHANAKRDNRDFRKGFDYVAGNLLISDGDIDTIEHLEDESASIFTDQTTMFQKGMRSALDSWYRLMPPILRDKL